MSLLLSSDIEILQLFVMKTGKKGGASSRSGETLHVAKKLSKGNDNSRINEGLSRISNGQRSYVSSPIPSVESVRH